MAQSLKGILIILAFLAGGELISWAINHFVPGNVIGMVLLFVALQTGIVKGNSVGKVADLLTSNMAIMFLPAGVGLMVAYKIVTANLVAIVFGTVISTLLVLAFVGKMQDRWGKKQ